MSLLSLILINLLISSTIIDAFECYVGAQFGATATPQYMPATCSGQQCSLEKLGGTIFKSCGGRLLNRQVSPDQFSVDNYNCTSHGAGFKCACGGNRCNELMPTSFPVLPTNNTLRCYVGFKVGSVDGYELTQCPPVSNVCYAYQIGASTEANCATYTLPSANSSVCVHDDDTFNTWNCRCNYANGCNYNITTTYQQPAPTVDDFQCTAGMSIAGYNGYKTVACQRRASVTNWRCLTENDSGVIWKSCANNMRCPNDTCRTSADGTYTDCCCGTSNCNSDQASVAPTSLVVPNVYRLMLAIMLLVFIAV